MLSGERSTWFTEVALPCHSTSPSEARAFVRGQLSAHDVLNVTDDVELVTSELATNAVLHARTPFLVTLQGDGSTILLTVQDESALFQPRPGRSGPEDAQGRGLLITELLSDRWGVDNGSSGAKTVWASFTAAVAFPSTEPRQAVMWCNEPA
jgi:anti-sigma regulatory factor (Ser/Thr protein kinase)